MWIHSLVIGHLYISLVYNEMFRGHGFALRHDHIDGLRWNTLHCGPFFLNIDWLW